MGIEITVKTPNNAELGYHELFQIFLTFPPGVTVEEKAKGPKIGTIINSWVSYADKQAGGRIMWQWNMEDILPFDRILDPEQGLVDSPVSPFFGGKAGDFSQPSIEVARMRKLLELSKTFTERNNADLVTPFGTVDGDDNSKVKISNTVTFWQLLERQGNAPETIEFTLADNSQVTLTPAQLDVIGAMLGVREQTLRSIRNARRIEVAEAETVEAVEAIRWDTMPVLTPVPTT